MDYRVLGPIEVWDGERRLSLGGARQRALLGMLLLHANHEVSGESLTGALWGEAPPERAANALRTHAAGLRRLLEPGRARGTASVLVTRGHGYLLRVDDDALDLHRFERLVDDGRRVVECDPAAASALLREAASLWRGPALEGVELSGAALVECAQLDDLRVAAAEDRVQADLALGRHTAMVGELEALVAAHPLRERLHAQRMLALYRCGRQADALEAYRDAHRHLDPGPDLRSLERAIVDYDPALLGPARAATPVVTDPSAQVADRPAPPAAEPAAAVPQPRRPRRAVTGTAALLIALGSFVALGVHSLRTATALHGQAAASSVSVPITPAVVVPPPAAIATPSAVPQADVTQAAQVTDLNPGTTTPPAPGAPALAVAAHPTPTIAARPGTATAATTPAATPAAGNTHSGGDDHDNGWEQAWRAFRGRGHD